MTDNKDIIPNKYSITGATIILKFRDNITKSYSQNDLKINLCFNQMLQDCDSIGTDEVLSLNLTYKVFIKLLQFCKQPYIMMQYYASADAGSKYYNSVALLIIALDQYHDTESYAAIKNFLKQDNNKKFRDDFLLYCNRFNIGIPEHCKQDIFNFDYNSINYQELDLYCNYEQNITGLYNVSEINISKLKLCHNLTTIKFHKNFDETLDDFKKMPTLWKENILELRFGTDFNQAITSLQKFINLKILIFHAHFNQSCESLKFCTDLEILCIDNSNFNQSLDFLRYLPKLRQLLILHRHFMPFFFNSVYSYAMLADMLLRALPYQDSSENITIYDSLTIPFMIKPYAQGKNKDNIDSNDLFDLFQKSAFFINNKENRNRFEIESYINKNDQNNYQIIKIPYYQCEITLRQDIFDSIFNTGETITSAVIKKKIGNIILKYM